MAELTLNLEPDFAFGIAGGPKQSESFRQTKAETWSNVEVHDTERHMPRNRVLTLDPKSTKSSQTILEHILPTTLQSRILEQQGKCIASLVTQSDKRCTAKCPGSNINKLCHELAGYKVESSASDMLACVQRLIRAATCGTHQRVAFNAKRWPTLQDLVLNFAHKSPAERSELQLWLRKITHGEVFSSPSFRDENLSHNKAKGAMKTPRKPQRNSPPVAENDYRKRQGLDTASQTLELISYQPKWTKNMAVSDVLFEIIAEPLKPTDLKPGFIYMFWEPGNFGKIKIGRTNNLERRLKEWNDSCKREHAYLPAISRGELAEIAHVSRIERLMHAELKEYRRAAYCSSCGRNHREWFEVNDSTVMGVFRKWRDWIVQRPYELNDQTQKWMLRREKMATVAEVCMPVVPEAREDKLPYRKNMPGRKPVRRKVY